MKRSFLVHINADITSDDLRDLICNDTRVGRLSLGKDNIQIIDMREVPQLPPELRPENIIAKAIEDLRREVNSRAGQDLSYAEQLIQTEQVAKLQAYKHCLGLLSQPE